jgi:hypothetical protein
LLQKKYENCWGVGRHVMGSQIFDYWYFHVSSNFLRSRLTLPGSIPLDLL